MRRLPLPFRKRVALLPSALGAGGTDDQIEDKQASLAIRERIMRGRDSYSVFGEAPRGSVD